LGPAGEALPSSADAAHVLNRIRESQAFMDKIEAQDEPDEDEDCMLQTQVV
jgi:hypothetical protein